MLARLKLEGYGIDLTFFECARGLYYVTLEQLKLHDSAKEAGMTAVLGCGCALGTTNVLARYTADKLDAADSINTYSGTILFEESRELRLTYSAQTMFDEITKDAIVLEGGELKKIPAMSGEETVILPEPIRLSRLIPHRTFRISNFPTFHKKGNPKRWRQHNSS